MNFINNSFLPRAVSAPLDFNRMIKAFLYPSSITVIERKVYVNIHGLKYFFSSLVSNRVFESVNVDVLEPKHSKFISWLVKFDFDHTVLKAHNAPYESVASCKFCRLCPSPM